MEHRLPSDADSEHIGASFENGVLKIELPKRQSPSKKTVEII
jgi:HSP20 family molecular chaperone IbpA